MIHGDTDVVPHGGGRWDPARSKSGAPPSTGRVDQGKTLAADLFEASPEDVILDKEAAAAPRGRHPGAHAQLG